jgi:cyclopropane fatty-acyl-phospholipid synthase-like methyltransferase
MINFNVTITQEQARYIIEEVFPKVGYRIDAKTLEWWMKAHNYAFKEQVGIPGCSCEYIQTYNVWSSRLSQYRQQIEDIAYPPVIVTPSEIIEEAVTKVQTLPNEIRVKTTRKKK